jgi:uncharacterized protein YgbK (DUF1537 family)
MANHLSPTLTKKLTQYTELIQSVAEKRELWKSMRLLLLSRLKTIVEASSEQLDVSNNDTVTNYESIILSFRGGHSGLVRASDTRRKALIKEGGYLLFAQSVNSKLKIIVVYPSVEDTISQQVSELIGKIDLSELTEELIDSYVEIFLDKMIGWEEEA